MRKKLNGRKRYNFPTCQNEKYKQSCSFYDGKWQSVGGIGGGECVGGEGGG